MNCTSQLVISRLIEYDRSDRPVDPFNSNSQFSLFEYILLTLFMLFSGEREITFVLGMELMLM